MEKKATIKDVAKAAGVCQATVSYVLNDRADQKISEKTKKKIWQVINMLNYKPNTFAKNLRGSQELKLIAVYSYEEQKPLVKAVFADFLERLTNTFQKLNYGVILLDKTPRKIDTADAIVVYRPNKKSFYALGEFNYVPMISVDCNVKDPLFFQVTYDYAELNQRAKEYFNDSFTFLCLSPQDDTEQEEISQVFENYLFTQEFSQLERIKAKNILVTDPVLHTLLSGFSKFNVRYENDLTVKRMNLIAKCVELALSHETVLEHMLQI